MTSPRAELRTADPGLPALEPALDPALAARAFEGAKRYAGARVQVHRAELTRHKPGRRAVIAYDFEMAWPNGRTYAVNAVGKMRASRPPRSAYTLLRRLWQNGFDAASADGISVPEPLAKVPTLGLWLQQRVDGAAATALLTTSAAVPLARRIADAAAKLHRAGVEPERAHGPDDEVAILERLLDGVGQRHGLPTPSLAALRRGCRSAASLLEGSSTSIHRDFYADQVIVDGARVYVLDFDLYCRGHAALDIGNFAGHLVEQALRSPEHAPALMAASDALAARYRAHADDDASGRAVRIYTALTLARLVALSTLLPGRDHTTDAVLEAAMTRLEALVDGSA